MERLPQESGKDPQMGFHFELYPVAQVVDYMRKHGDIERLVGAETHEQELEAKAIEIGEIMEDLRRDERFKVRWEEPDSLYQLAVANLGKKGTPVVRLDGNGTWD